MIIYKAFGVSIKRIHFHALKSQNEDKSRVAFVSIDM